MSNLVIYTVITGGKDTLSEDINIKGAKAVCFTDDPTMKSKKWEIRLIPNLFKDVRRDSRMVKMLPHIYFPDASHSLYLDGNIICKVPMQRLVDEWLEDTDIALFKHHTRNCLFDEADECIRLELDDKEVIERHKMRYAGFPKGKGLYQCGVILRKHTTKIKRLNEMWWAEYCAGCKRDQVSFPYCLEKEGISINAINSYAHLHFYFEYNNHKILSEWAGKLI
jgi:hypothetical protein